MLPFLPKNALFFDIETGGLRAKESSVFSLTYGQRGRQLRTGYASPVRGSFVSKWAEDVVLSKIQGKKAVSEQKLLESFLGKLEGRRAGSTLAGWNIGYKGLPQEGWIAGFDIPFLVSRAGKYGLQERYQRAFGRLTKRDIGQEFLAGTASRIYGFAKNLPQERLTQIFDPDIYRQLEPYGREAYALQKGGMGIPEIAQRLQGKRVSGWKQDLAYELITGKPLTSAHMSEVDVQAMMEMSGKTLDIPEEQFARKWHSLALKNRLISAAKAEAGRGGEIGWGALEARATKYGLDWGSIRKTIESEQKYFSGSGRIWGREAAEEVVSKAKPFLAGRRGLLIGGAVAAGAALLYAVKPLRWLNDRDEQLEAVKRGELAGVRIHGSDDVYNEIEGMSEQGIGPILRHAMTPFGSGMRFNDPNVFVGQEVFRGILEEERVGWKRPSFADLLKENVSLRGFEGEKKVKIIEAEMFLEKIRVREFPEKVSREFAEFWTSDFDMAKNFAAPQFESEWGKARVLKKTIEEGERFSVHTLYDYSDFERIYFSWKRNENYYDKADTIDAARKYWRGESVGREGAFANEILFESGSGGRKHDVALLFIKKRREAQARGVVDEVSKSASARKFLKGEVGGKVLRYGVIGAAAGISALILWKFMNQEKPKPEIETDFGSPWKGPVVSGPLARKVTLNDPRMFNTVEGLMHGGMNEQKRHEMTPFGGPFNWAKGLFRKAFPGQKNVSKILSEVSKKEGVVVFPEKLMGYLPKEMRKEYSGLVGGYLPLTGTQATRARGEMAFEDVFKVLRAQTRGDEAGRELAKEFYSEVAKKTGPGGGILVSERGFKRVARKAGGTDVISETIAHERTHMGLRGKGLLEDVEEIFDMTGASGGYKKWLDKYKKNSYYSKEPGRLPEEYVAHAAGAAKRGMTKAEKEMYAPAVAYLKSTPELSEFAGLQFQNRMADLTRAAQQQAALNAKNGAKNHIKHTSSLTNAERGYNNAGRIWK